MNGTDPSSNGGLTPGQSERLRATLGAIGDEAAEPRSFEQVVAADDVAPLNVATGATRRRVLAGAATACLLVVAGVVVWQSRDGGAPRVTGTSTETTPITTTPDSSAPTTSQAASSVVEPDGVSGPWYSVDLAGVTAGPVSTPAVEPEGAVSMVWASADGSASHILVLHQFAVAPAVSTLTGTQAQEILPVDGELVILSDPTDVPDSQVPTLVGNEMRWTLPDGEVLEFASHGIEPSELSQDVAIARELLARNCLCPLPGLEFMGEDDDSTALLQQIFEVDGATVTLTRSTTSPANADALGDPAGWTTSQSRQIDDLPGMVVDDDRAVWKRDGFWFSLSDVPADRLDDMLGALQRIGSSPSALQGAATALVQGWNELPLSPLSPRTGAISVWTGTEIVVVGGSEYTCPPNASCVAFEGETFTDGAAYDPSTNAWRSIAAAPLPLDMAVAAVVRGDIYVYVPPATHLGVVTGQVHLLRYQPSIDTWSEISKPPIATFGTRLIGVGDTLILYQASHETTTEADWAYGPESNNWFELPADGMGTTYDRQMVAGDGGVLLFAKPPPTTDLSQVDVASYSFGGRAFVPLDSRDGYGADVWRIAEEVVMSPNVGGRGGVFEVESQTWSDLPPPPAADSWNGAVIGAFGIEESGYGSQFNGTGGWALDQCTQTWVEIPPVDARSSPSITSVGRNMFVFGGQDWTSGDSGRLLGDAWLWVPPPP